MTQTTVARTSTGAAPVDRRSWTWCSLLGAWTPAAVALAFLGYAVSAGLPVDGAVRATLAVVVTQLLPGVLVWRAVRPRHGWWIEDLAIGFAIGTAIAIAAQTVAGLTGQRWIAVAVGLAVAIGLLGVPAMRRRIAEARTSPLPWWWGPIVSLVSLAAIWQLSFYHRRVPVNWPSGSRALDVDATLHLAMAAELAHRGPENFPWVIGEPLAYHWFSHAWIAQISMASGAGLDDVVFRFMPALMPLAVTLVVGIAAVRLTGRFYAGPVAAVLTMAMAEVNVFGRLSVGEPVAPLSPSLGLSVPLLVALVVLLAVRWRGEARRGAVVLLPVLALAAAGTKGSTAPVLVAGLGMALLAMLVFDRTRVRAVLVDLAIAAGCLLFAMLAVFRGSDSGLHIDLVESVRSSPAAGWLGGIDGFAEGLVAAVAVVAGILARGAAGLALVFTRDGRRDPVTWLLLGGGVAGAGAVVVFAHPGFSQYYFARSAVPLLALASTLGIVALVKRLPGRVGRLVLVGAVAGPVMGMLTPAVFGKLDAGDGVDHALLLMAVAAVVLAAAGVAGAVLGTPHRRIAVAAALTFTVLAAGIAAYPKVERTYWSAPPPEPVHPASSMAVSKDQITAARWIRDHSDVDDLVMTNRHCSRPVAPVKCDARHFTVTGFSERRSLVEAWTPTTTANRLGPKGRESIVIDYWRPDLLRLNDGFIRQPTQDAADKLRDLGVRWVFVDFTRPHARTLEPYAELRFRTATAVVYELR